MGDETKKKQRARGVCRGCPGALACWGGEQLVAADCVVCGQLLLGRVFPGKEVSALMSDDTEILGLVPRACGEVRCVKTVCADCRPSYRKHIDELLYGLIRAHADVEST